MDNLAISDQFIKSLLFAFFVSAVVIGILQVIHLIEPEHLVGREGIAWLIAIALCAIEPVLRYCGVLKGGIENRISELMRANLLGRVIGAPAGCLFTWAITIIGS